MLHHALRMRRSALMNKSALWLTLPSRYTNSSVWLYTWSATSTLNMALNSTISFVHRHMISVLVPDTVRPNAAHTTSITPIIFVSCAGDCKTTSESSAQNMPQSGVARTGSPAVTPSRPPPLSFRQMHQSAHDVFVRLETHVGHVYSRREEYVEQDGCKHTPLTKALFHNEQLRVHPVIEPHACSNAIVELTNDRDHIMWHAKTGECCPEEGSVNGVVRFGK